MSKAIKEICNNSPDTEVFDTTWIQSQKKTFYTQLNKYTPPVSCGFWLDTTANGNCYTQLYKHMANKHITPFLLKNKHIRPLEKNKHIKSLDGQIWQYKFRKITSLKWFKGFHKIPCAYSAMCL